MQCQAAFGLWKSEWTMQGDPKVIDYLNKGLRSELTAINQYWLHYRLLDNWGYKDLAKTWRKESIEEMWHADKLIERIIFLDGAPNMQTLDSLHIWKTVKAVLDNDLQDELSAHALYAEAATHCHSVNDYVTRDLCLSNSCTMRKAYRLSRNSDRVRREDRP